MLTAFKDGGFFAKADTAFPNMAFTPGANAWCKLAFLFADPVVATLGLHGADRFDGFFQIDLNYPLNTGDKAVKDKADALRNAFTAGVRFTYSGQEVIVTNCGRSQGRIIEGYYRVSVTVYFYAHINR